MGRIIRMTESQINAIIQHLSEDTAPITIDATADVAAANGNASVGMKRAKDRMTQQGLANKDTTMTCDSDAINEKFLTKRQINERRLKYLRENSVRYTKKQIEKRW